MNENPSQRILKLYTDTIAEIFDPEEQSQILIVMRRNRVDLTGPEHLTRTLHEAVGKKIKSPPMA